MSRFYRGGVALKPENAVKRADELVGVSNGTSSAPMARRAARQRPFGAPISPRCGGGGPAVASAPRSRAI
jgi:hypothetical protein